MKITEFQVKTKSVGWSFLIQYDDVYIKRRYLETESDKERAL